MDPTDLCSSGDAKCMGGGETNKNAWVSSAFFKAVPFPSTKLEKMSTVTFETVKVSDLNLFQNISNDTQSCLQPSNYYRFFFFFFLEVSVEPVTSFSLGSRPESLQPLKASPSKQEVAAVHWVIGTRLRLSDSAVKINKTVLRFVFCLFLLNYFNLCSK